MKSNLLQLITTSVSYHFTLSMVTTFIIPCNVLKNFHATNSDLLKNISIVFDLIEDHEGENVEVHKMDTVYVVLSIWFCLC